jgi:methyltransferase (TIGR00027 family)
MKKTHASTTAEGMAVIRVIESKKRADVRLFSDPIAVKMVPAFSAFMSGLVISSGLYDKMAPGVLAFITARERYIDDFLKTCLAEGFTQVVILGAGFDTRAYRIAGIDKVHVFEVDHPDTQAYKLERLKKVVDPLPVNVSFVAVDFNTQSLSERLLASCYSESGKTLFIWQGVLVYLTREGVDNTLAFIAHHSAPGSAVVFDYFYNETLHDMTRPEVKLMWRAAKVTGEAYLFGIDQGQIEPFLMARGFSDVRNVTGEGLKRLYFTGANAGRILPTGCDIVSARVG